MDRDEDKTQYVVVINHEEQYSIWPASRELPAGWQRVGEPGEKKHLAVGRPGCQIHNRK